ncbi:hypothetical protein T36_1276 [Helicobacter cinaedi]|uniref:MobP1 family relaxase n=1 Tax=Helicobacter cinaedi TaxID=213 RepID=UPI001F157BF9|nr:MobP1 family relaxase [Helicobacter cinaedi]BDB64819.1 hypothetical protein T36_1276 [Helicobacter cinaedi]
MSAIPKYFAKRFSDDESEFNIWKGRQVQKARANRSFANYTKLKHIHSKYYKRKREKAQKDKEMLKTFDMSAYHKQRDRKAKLMSGGYEVMIKITSNARNKTQLLKHIEYISRDGELELLSADNHIFLGKADNKDCVESYANIPQSFERVRERRETYNMVFSMRDYEECEPHILQEAAFATMKKLYPDSQFVLALHKDTDNPHCYICLNANNFDGSRIHIQKKDLFAMRQSFAKELNERGVYALATKRSDSYRGYEIALNAPRRTELDLKQKFYGIIDFGEAPYNDDNLNKDSFFISYLVNNRKVTIWGEHLKELAQKYDLQQSDFIRVKKIGYKLRPYTFEKTIGGKTYEITNAAKVAVWDISIRDRAEKDFVKLPKPPTFKPIVRLKQSTKPTQKESNNANARPQYTREQWAAFNAERNARKYARSVAKYNKQHAREPRYNAFTGFRESNTELQWRATRSKPYLSESNLDTLASEITAKHNLPIMPQSNVDKESAQHQMLLPSDAQHNLPRRPDSANNDNRELRPANHSDTRNATSQRKWRIVEQFSDELESKPTTEPKRYTREQWAKFNAKKNKGDMER